MTTQASAQVNAQAFTHRPLPIKVINGIGGMLRKSGLRRKRFNAEELLETATRRTKLTDWGGDEFLSPLRLLLKSYEDDARLTSFGRFMCRENCLNILKNRLYIRDELKKHPEALERPVSRPLFIVGFPRTGTTLLHRLFAQDPNSRSLRLWETEPLSPLPTPATYATDPRIKEFQKKLGFLHWLVPHFQTIHPTAPENEEECTFLMRNNFVVPLYFEPLARVTSFADWLHTQDLTPTYEYFKQQLQLLQLNFPSQHWVLKSPGHLYQLDALLKVFPDAGIVQTHRDPKKMMASWCSLVATVEGMVSDSVDPRRVGRRWLDLWVHFMKRSLEVREKASAQSFFDVSYDELMRDPIAVVEKIYAHFGYPVSAQMRSNMQGWLAANPQNKHGVHRYSLDQFGLSAADIDAKFGFYMDRFAIRKE